MLKWKRNKLNVRLLAAVFGVLQQQAIISTALICEQSYKVPKLQSLVLPSSIAFNSFDSASLFSSDIQVNSLSLSLRSIFPKHQKGKPIFPLENLNKVFFLL